MGGAKIFPLLMSLLDLDLDMGCIFGASVGAGISFFFR